MKILRGISISLNALLVLCLISGFAFADDSLYIDTNGNIGIGTTGPESKLHIKDGTGGKQLRFSRGTGTVRFEQSNNEDTLYLFNSDASENYMTWKDGGNVGINNTSPSYTLDVSGSMRLADSANTNLILKSSGGSANSLLWWYNNSDAANFYFGQLNENGPLRLYNYAASETSLVVKTDGNVGIGMTGPTQKLQVEGNVAPGTDDEHDLGSSSFRWKNIHATNDTIQISDERRKDNINDIPLGLDFINQLRPIAYKWKDYDIPEVKETRTVERQKIRRVSREVRERTIALIDGKYVQREIVKPVEVEERVYEEHPLYDENGNQIGIHKIPVMETADEEVVVQKERKETFHRIHYGLSAQQVKATMDSFGVDFDGVVYHAENDTYGIRMGEFVPVLMKAVQELKAEVDQLKAEISQLKASRN